MALSITPPSRASTFFPFRTKEVRDLAWALASTNLLSGDAVVGQSWCDETYAAHKSRLETLDRDPGPLLAFILDRLHNHRLGIYFETLMAYWLERILKMPELRQNVPVREGGVTLGEFDFLFLDRARDCTTHWETAVKFYLHEPVSGLYYGPNAKDRLDLKMSKIFDRQLPLARHLKSELRSEGFVKSEAFVKGLLFYPLVDKLSTYGWWHRLSERHLDAFDPDSRWILPHSGRHLAPALLPPDATVLTFDDVLTTARGQRSLMIAEVGIDESGWFLEKSRGCIVEDSWPDF